MSHFVRTTHRELVVRFICGRCGAEDYALYESNSHRDEIGNMRVLKAPEGWTAELGYMPLMCPKCSKAHIDFMNRGGEARCQHKSE